MLSSRSFTVWPGPIGAFSRISTPSPAMARISASMTARGRRKDGMPATIIPPALGSP